MLQIIHGCSYLKAIKFTEVTLAAFGYQVRFAIPWPVFSVWGTETHEQIARCNYPCAGGNDDGTWPRDLAGAKAETT